VLLLRSVARALDTSLTELIDPREGSVEKRLIRRFLDRLPVHRLEDAVFRLVRDYGEEAATRRKRIALVGLRGAGKTTLGNALCRRGRPAVRRARPRDRGRSRHQPVRDFPALRQAGYRRIERRCLERLIAGASEVVVAVGGGIVSEPDAYNLLLQHCFTVWVKASPDEHMARVVAQGDLRPMQGRSEAMADLTRILDAREPLYRKADRHARHLGRDAAAESVEAQQAIAA
jgi:XRE family aerobic/anaerobic benzoate catabolism transcriptional regulator